MESEKRVQRVVDLFENGRAYKRHLGLDEQIKRSINFVEGRQWTNAEGTEDYPKIVLNYIKQIMKVRQSGILQNDYSFLVNTLKFEDTKKIQYFMKYLYNTCRIRRKNLKVIADNFKKGTSGLYFYWDNDVRSPLATQTGALKAEVFDVRQLVVADPSIQEIQEQEWVIYNIREKVGALKFKYPEKAKEIFSDGYYVLSETQREQVGQKEDDELTNVYIYYFRNEEGQVCYSIHTQFVELQEPTFLNPSYEGDLEEMPNTLSSNDEKEEKEYENPVFGLYPFAVYVMDERDNDFYGLPGAYEFIEAQKSINAHFSNYDYAIGQNVLGGFIMKKGVLGDQEISTDNAQILQLDMLPGDRITDMFARIPVNNIPSDALSYSGVLGGNLRTVSGATNIQMGQADYSNQTAKATEMLLARARENSSDYAIMFEEYMVDVANVMFMFAKFYYDRKEFNIVEHGNEKDTNIEFKEKEAFHGTEYQMDFVDFDIQVSPSQSFNETVLQQLAMMAVQTGNLKMLSVLKMLPYNTFPSFKELKDELLKEDTTMAIIKQQEEQLKQAQQVLQQMSKEYQKMQDKMGTMDTVVQENLRLKEQMAEVYAKSIEQTKEATQNMNNMQAEVIRMINMLKGGK